METLEITTDDTEVEPIPGERMCYAVRSSTNPKKKYRVDLIAYHGAGQCHCRDWEIRRWPAIKAGEPAGTRRTLCRHGILARRYFTNTLLARLALEEEPK